MIAGVRGDSGLSKDWRSLCWDTSRSSMVLLLLDGLSVLRVLSFLVDLIFSPLLRGGIERFYFTIFESFDASSDPHMSRLNWISRYAAPWVEKLLLYPNAVTSSLALSIKGSLSLATCCCAAVSYSVCGSAA